MLIGTPTWSMPRLGSGVMTERPEKLTRLPIRLPRTRPYLPFKRDRSVLSGRPPRCVDCATEASSLSSSVAQWYCSCSRNSSCACGGSPRRMPSSSASFERTMSAYLYVRSSSPRAAPSVITAGRTGGGATGSTVTTIQSGRAKRGSNPSSRASSSEMRRRISSAFCGNSVWLRSEAGMSARWSNSTWMWYPCRLNLGCIPSHPVRTPSSRPYTPSPFLPPPPRRARHTFLPRHTRSTSFKRTDGRLLIAARNAGSDSSDKSMPQWKQTH
mmetsp:Transcript_10070/g.31761  ORF Transcript_10070/g.31761 Transcript_10070/m.31761 type:complete len:270 (+) Transcript_10070:3863-4672(+)